MMFRHYRDSRDIGYPVLVLDHGAHLVRQLARHLGRVHAGQVVVEALPLGDPGLARVGEGDDALEDLGRAGLDLVLGAGEVEELLAVGAAMVAEALGRCLVYL